MKQFLPLGQTPVATVLIKRMLIVEGYLLGPVTLVAIVFYPFLLLLPSLSLSLSLSVLSYSPALSLPLPLSIFLPTIFLFRFLCLLYDPAFIYSPSLRRSIRWRERGEEKERPFSLSLSPSHGWVISGKRGSHHVVRSVTARQGCRATLRHVP